MRRAILYLLLLLCMTGSAAGFLFRGVGGTGGGGGPCTFTGSIAGSCLPSSDTTDQILGSQPNTSGIINAVKFDTGGNGVLANGGQPTCVGLYQTNAFGNSCGLTTQVWVCQTPGNSGSSWRPSLGEDVVAWQAPPLGYNAQGQNVLNTTIPLYAPALTLDATNGSLPSWSGYITSFRTGVCPSGTDTTAYFTDSVLGAMPNLMEALRAMSTTGETLTVSPSPAGIPFWTFGGNNFFHFVDVGPDTDVPNPPSHLTLNLTGALFGYSLTGGKGVFNIEQNATTINGGTCFWVQPGGSISCVAWDAGLDLTINNLRTVSSSMGLDRGSTRQGITNLTNFLIEDSGCTGGCRVLGSDHPLYINRIDNGDFDAVFGTNVVTSGISNQGWGIKLRPANTNFTQSFFANRTNNGASWMHAAMDMPCRGTHSVSFSALEMNQYSFNFHVNGQGGITFIAAIGEEAYVNAATLPGGGNLSIGTSNCPQNVLLPNAGGLAATITSPKTFTTTTNPSTFWPLTTFSDVNGVWDLGMSGTMLNGPSPPSTGVGPSTSWQGPPGGPYTVSVGNFYAEGTLPLQVPAATRFAAFAATSGSLTLYPIGNPVTVVSNNACPSTCTASWSMAGNPAIFGIAVGDLLIDGSQNPLTVTSIAGTGPYTITASCSVASPFGGGNCLTLPEPGSTVLSASVVSGTYNSSTGAVSLTIGTDIGLAPGAGISVAGTIGSGGGAGNASQLDGSWTTTSGTTGTTVNYTGPTGLGTINIGAFGGAGAGGLGVKPSTIPGLPSTLDQIKKVGPSQITADTTGSGCDGTNTLCNIAFSPAGMQIYHGRQVLGTGVPNTCVVAGRIAWIWPVKGSSGTGYAVNDTITLAGGTFEQAAVVTVTSVSGGAVTGVNVTTGGVYTSFATGSADHKTFTQASTSGSGTGAQFEFPFPQIIVTGSGPYTLRLAQTSGANCITSAVTSQLYQIIVPVSVTWDHNLIGWDGICPNFGTCTVLYTPNQQTSWEPETVTNSILWTDVAAGGPVWNTPGPTGQLILAMTDGGGNIFCNNRSDTGTNALCAIPPFTVVNFSGGISGVTSTGGSSTATLTVDCASGSSCMTISSGTYNSTSGLVTLTVSNSNTIQYIGSNGLQGSFTVSGLTGTGGSLSSLNGNWYAAPGTTGTTLTYQAPTGLGSITISGGNINPAAGATACQPGMFVWDNQGQLPGSGGPGYGPGAPGAMLAGTSITAGTASPYTLYIPPGGSSTLAVSAGTAMACGWGTPSSVFNGTINSSGVLTVNSGLRGSLHIGDYLADISSTLPSNVRVSSGSGTTWQTTYSGGGVSAETMVSVRSDAP